MFNITCRSEIEGLGPKTSLRYFLNRHEDDIMEIGVGNPEIIRDLDTIKDDNKELK